MDNQSISGATVSSSRMPPSGLPGHPTAPPASLLGAGAMGQQILAAQGTVLALKFLWIEIINLATC